MIEARSVEPADLPGLLALFDAADCRCHCRYWHFEGDKNEWLARCYGEPEQNRAELEGSIRGAHPEGEGVVALSAGAIVGWAKVARAGVASKAFEQRFYRALPCFGGDRSGVMLLGCTLVHPGHRRRGVATALAKAAIEHARARGAVALEALPRRTSEPVADEELWTGPFAALLRLGFVEVGGEGPYPVLRLPLTDGAR